MARANVFIVIYRLHGSSLSLFLASRRVSLSFSFRPSCRTLKIEDAHRAITLGMSYR